MGKFELDESEAVPVSWETLEEDSRVGKFELVESEAVPVSWNILDESEAVPVCRETLDEELASGGSKFDVLMREVVPVS